MPRISTREDEAGKKFFDVNRNIKLRITSPGSREPVEYASRIEEVTRDTYSVSYPMSRGLLVELHEGQLIEVTGGDGSAYYRFRTRVAGRVLVGPVPLLILRRPDEIQRIERRNWFRLSVLIELRFWTLDDDKIESFRKDMLAVRRERPDPNRGGRYEDEVLQEYGLNPQTAISGYATNISGSGLQLSCEKKLESGQSIFLEIDLNGPSVKTLGRVVGVRERGQTNRYGVEFVDIDQRQRDMIIKFIFAKQLEMRRRGLL